MLSIFVFFNYFMCFSEDAENLARAQNYNVESKSSSDVKEDRGMYSSLSLHHLYTLLLSRENLSFRTKLIVGDFLRPSGETDDSGEEKYVRLTCEEIKVTLK